MWLDLLFTSLLVVFFMFALYNLPIVITGARGLLKARRKKMRLREDSVGELPMVSIIIPLKNEERVVSRLLKALTNVEYPKGKKEIIVVDDASTDRTRETCFQYSLVHPEFRILSRSKSTTKAAALNFGLSKANGEIIATFDGDSVPERDTLMKAVKHFADPSVAGVQGRICSINAGQNMLTRFISFEWAVQFEVFTRGKDELNLFVALSGTCQFIRKEAIEEVGGWNEECLAEDTELSLRLIEKDHLIKYDSEVRTREESPFNVRGLVAQRSRWYRGNIEIGTKFGRLMKKPNLRRVDAEVTLFGTFMILLCATNYFMPLWFFLVPSTLFTFVIAQFTSFATIFILGIVGLSLVFAVKPFRLRNLLWLPFIYAYWGFQSLIALYALFQIILRRPKRWHKTERSGLITKAEQTIQPNFQLVNSRRQVFR